MYFLKEKSEARGKWVTKIDTGVKWVFPAIALIISGLTYYSNREDKKSTSTTMQSLQKQLDALKDSLKGKANLSNQILDSIKKTIDSLKNKNTFNSPTGSYSPLLFFLITRPSPPGFAFEKICKTPAQT